MDQSEFNRQMGAYLRDRKKEGGFLSKLKPRVTIVDDDKPLPPEEVPREQVEAVMRGERVEPEVVDDDDFSVEPDPDRPRFWKRVFGWISFGSPDDLVREDDDDVDVGEIVRDGPGVDSDVKEMLRICVHWVNQLPPDKLQDIKRSDDFEKFKRLLDKYGLIKKK